jgi:hypothetical protein
MKLPTDRIVDRLPKIPWSRLLEPPSVGGIISVGWIIQPKQAVHNFLTFNQVHIQQRTQYRRLDANLLQMMNAIKFCPNRVRSTALVQAAFSVTTKTKTPHRTKIYSIHPNSGQGIRSEWRKWKRPPSDVHVADDVHAYCNVCMYDRTGGWSGAWSKG